MISLGSVPKTFIACEILGITVCNNYSPQGLWESGENGYLFSVGRGALVIILEELGSNLIVLGI